MTLARRPDLVVVAPLPPTRSGIAAYTAELLPHLASARRVVCVVAGPAEVAAAGNLGVEVISAVDWAGRTAVRAAPHLFQLGNSLDHAHVYALAMQRRGVVVLHEIVLHHLVEALTLGRGRTRAYAAALEYGYGPAGRRLARLRQLGVFAPRQRFLLPLHRQIVDRAAHVIVHSRWAAARIEATHPVPITVVPHHLSPAVAAYDGVGRAAARARLGLPVDRPILAALGHATPSKQLDVAVRALAALPTALLVIGGEIPPASPLPALIAELGLEARVRRTGWLDPEAFFLHLRAADLVLALRHPSGGESSGTLARALGMGTPAVVPDAGPAAEYPDAAVLRLPAPPAPEAGLAAAAAAFFADPDRAAAMGAAARAHMLATARIEASAAAMLAAVDAMRA